MFNFIKSRTDLIGVSLYIMWLCFCFYSLKTYGFILDVAIVSFFFITFVGSIIFLLKETTNNNEEKIQDTITYIAFMMFGILWLLGETKFYYFYYNLDSFLVVADFSTLMGFPKPANDTMFSIIALLSEMTILLTFILFGVLISLAYIIDVYNAESNPFPRHFEKSIESTLDVLFVIFPTIIIIYLLIPSLGFIFNNETAVETVFDLDIIGHQWYWSYEYSLSIGITLYDIFADENTLFNRIEFDSLMDQEATYNRLLQVDKRVIIPVNTLIKATVTSQDVIHSWAVPQLGIKYDAIPGRLISFILHSNLLGIFYGQCSELCGVNHAFMPICVQSVENDIFLDWVLCSLHINPSKLILDSISHNNLDLIFTPVIFSNFDK
jgi:heme/copper-type cytochrome/quinol oxidase subunit 2